MNKLVITLAAAFMLGTSLSVLAQEQDPNNPGASEAQPDQQAEPLKKKKKKHAEEQQQEAAPPAAGDQSEQPVRKRKKKEQAEQPQEQAPPPAAEEQIEQPVKKRKKKEQAEQPQEQAPPPAAEEQTEQPVKKRKKKEQAEQPVEPTPPPAAEGQPEQPLKKKKKDQAEQPQTPEQQPTEGQAGQPEQPLKKKKKDQAEQPQTPEQQPTEGQAEQPEKKKKKDQAEQPQTPEQQPAEGQAEQPKTGQPAAETSPEVTQYLSDKRPASELSDAELAERARQGRQLMRTKGLPENVRQELAREAKKARAESLAREQGKGQGQQPTQGQEQPPTGEATKGDQGTGQPTKPTTGEAQQPEGGAQPTQPTGEAEKPVENPDKKQVEKLDGNKASPEAEAKAKVYLDDSSSADQLKDDALRDRLEGMRALLAGNELSQDSERALRRKLRAERDILRNRVAEKVVGEEKRDDEMPTKQRRRDRDERKWDNWAERDVLRDRRRSEDLEEGELRRRIDIYRDAINDDQYDAEERAYWRDTMERDRRYLRDRMTRDRSDRERYWRDRRDKNELNIDINIDLGADREPREDAFMDEIDDEELQDYLVAAPRRKVERRYTIEEIEEEPEVRTAMPAIEVDNVHFGFNESFVREEEVEKLDRIAEVIEKILAAHPREVFLIEGHTDAVGGDAYNLKLSRERAEAVKKALTTYYVIPARNLKTVGYGERYLKIPTSDAEEENRRVSMRRVTPLVGEAEAE